MTAATAAAREAPAAAASGRSGGQSLVEFAVVLIPFLFLLMGIVDLGRGIYIYNGASQAAREIARVTSVYPCNTASCTLGNSAETQAVIATQKRLVPNLASASASITFQCTDITDVDKSNSTCQSRENDAQFVRVTVSVPFSVLTPVLSMVAPKTLTSTTHIQLP